MNAETYADLWQWSVDRYDLFWEKFFHYSGIKYSQPHSKVSRQGGSNPPSQPLVKVQCRLNFGVQWIPCDGGKVVNWGRPWRRNLE